MKIEISDDIIIYLNKLYMKNLDIEDKESIEKIIKKIEKIYNINIDEFQNINIYKDRYYGIIIEIKCSHDYLDYFKYDIEMNIKEDTFIYEIEDLTDIDFKNVTVYKNKDNIYLKLNTDILLGPIIEKSKIIYGNEAKNIIRDSRIMTEVIIWKDK